MDIVKHNVTEVKVEVDELKTFPLGTDKACGDCNEIRDLLKRIDSIKRSRPGLRIFRH